MTRDETIAKIDADIRMMNAEGDCRMTTFRDERSRFKDGLDYADEYGDEYVTVKLGTEVEFKTEIVRQALGR